MKTLNQALNLARFVTRCGSRWMSALCLVTLLFVPALTQAHDIPSRVTVYAFVKPEGNQLTALLRVPMEAFGEIVFPLRGPGYLVFSEAEFELYCVTTTPISDGI